MKVLLISPPFWNFGQKKPLFFNKLFNFPLGLGYLGGTLEKNNIESTILDMNVFDMSLEELKDVIRELKPDMAGLTSTTITYLNASKIARAIKEVNPRIKVVLGGIHASYEYCNVMNENPYIDFIVRFEGEYIFPELIKAIGENKNFDSVKNIVFRNGKEIISTPVEPRIKDLDSLPFPAYHLSYKGLDVYKESSPDKTLNLDMITSRGCPYKCAFCSTSQFHGQTYRMRSVENVIREIELLVDQYNVTYISFSDDTFTQKVSRTVQFCEEMIKRKIPVKWGCSSRVDRVDRDLLNIMKEAGCVIIFYGIDTVSPEVNSVINKPITPEQAKKAIAITREAGISVLLSFILGLPGETKETLKAFPKFLNEAEPSVMILPNILNVFPGSELYNNPDKYGIKFSRDDILKPNWSEPRVYNSSITSIDLVSTQIEMFYAYHKKLYPQMGLFKLNPPEFVL